MIRVLLADDHALFRQGLRSLLESEGFRVIGEAVSGREAVRYAAETHPDVILMDIQMPELDGVKATQSILEIDPNARVIMITMYRQDRYVFEAVKAGARGYILKDADATTLIDAIKRVAAGEALLDDALAQSVLDDFRDKKEILPSEKHSDLNERETTILKLLAQGYSNQDIALRLDISEKTVRNRLSEIFTKLQLNNRTQAALYAIREGIANLE
ncbi:response regulator [Deinococcus peraridilitoris]|uniref:Response regulator containing a CheY-like receiver domain and an HTH DNA-binding domain protein n=1 Tax=Deinococcus peraridilitoris (strain DSM 19664 / LMG 22246 / CIP 109416 / KR-200) TaxID=937777 RepID=K9ZXK8_DEIPD|nr:response regulator transcription factor [Deinococcus peraridilitoris]AFZ66326.1 response regulator containing a CheY-like receiver domain and an HTH DNA-binding domain protein [Deinococcus peraridilitoris DSM 19664]